MLPKGRQNEAGTHKFDSTIGQYEIKCSSHVLTGDIENVKNLN
jgi:plastocyanin